MHVLSPDFLASDEDTREVIVSIWEHVGRAEDMRLV